MSKTYMYPSKDFPFNAMESIESQKIVEIQVAGKLRKKLLLEHLPYLMREKLEKPPFWNTLLRLILLGDFQAIYGAAVQTGGYELSYQLLEDDKLLIRFTR